MRTSRRRGNGSRPKRHWLRRVHRWLGVAAALFLLVLSATGVALNHTSDWGLDSRYITWRWLLDSYGVNAPDVSASFTDRGYRATLLGTRLYLGEREIEQNVDALTGLIALDQLLMATSRQRILLFTSEGELVERMALPAEIPGPVDRAGRAEGRAIIVASGQSYRADDNVTSFVAWDNAEAVDIDWSQPSLPPAALVNALKEQYRGSGLTIERVIADVHSGRIGGVIGTYLMDAVGILLIILSLSGLLLWLRPRGGRRA